MRVTDILRRTIIGRVWARRRGAQLLRRYRGYREHYYAAAQALPADKQGWVRRIRASLAADGIAPRCKRLGDVNTFAFVSSHGWQSALFGDLAELGRFTRFDHEALGFSTPQLANHVVGPNLRRKLNEQFFSNIRDAHARDPVDWVLLYGGGLQIEAACVRRIRAELKIPTVLLSLDCKHVWDGDMVGGQRSGIVDLIPTMNACWTSSRETMRWYAVEGGNPIYIPEGFDIVEAREVNADEGLPISFVGAAYGSRREMISQCRSAGLPIHCFGSGWEGGQISGVEVKHVFRRSRINLGIGSVGYCDDLTTLKGRDFEVPGARGGVYLTTFNPELAECFVVGREILCYRGVDELIEIARRALEDPHWAATIARAGADRAMAEHRWLHRYQTILETLNVIDEN